MLAVSLALAASLCWGFADFGGGFFSRRISALAVVLVLETGGLLGALVVLAVTREAPPDLRSLGLAALGGAVGTCGLVCFFRGMALGAMSVVAPVFASGSALIPVVVGLATGDAITVVVGAGLGLAVLGILLASLEGEKEAEHSRQAAKAFGLALLGACGAAVYVVCSDVASDGSVLWTLVVARVAAIPCVALGVRVSRTPLPVRRDALRVGVVGLVDLAATACFALATTKGALAVVAVLGAMYPVVTAGLARGVLGERVRRVQLAGVAFALLGVALVAAG